jgi:hypothetical protein
MLTITTFKKFCLKAGTKKADEIHDYYIRLEELLHETINEETDDLRNQLLLKDKTYKIDLKKQKHKTLIELLKTKKCIYIGEIEENKLIKIGSSKQVDERITQLNNEYEKVIYLEIFECENFREAEEDILNDNIIKQNLCKKQIKTNGKGSKEVVELSADFTYENLIGIVKKYVNERNSTTLTSTQFLEKQKMDLEKTKMEHELLLAILRSDKHTDILKPMIENIFPEMLKNIASSINKEKIKEQIEEETKEKIKEEIGGKIEQEIKMQIKEEIKKHESEMTKKKIQNIEKEIEKEIEKKNKIINPNNDILLDVNRNARKPAGRKIQQIDPNDLTKVIKVYDSMSYLMRSPENIRFKKACLEKALNKNLIYKDYRWCYVEKDQDPKVSHAKPTVASKSIDADVILQLDETKSKILNTFSTKKEAVKNLGICINKLNKIIQNGEKIYKYYLINYSDCSKELLDKYDGSTIRKVKAANSLGPIKRIDPITKNEVIFNTFEEIDIRLGFRRPTIKKAIETKTLWGGFSWEFCEKK